MKCRFMYIFLCLLFTKSSTIYAEPLISFFFHAYPYNIQDTQNFIKKLHRPEKLAKYQQATPAYIPRVSGIFCSYAGFLTASTQTGQVVFPRKHSSHTFTFVVTPTVQPIVAFGTTIQKLIMPPNAALYTAKLTIEKKQELNFWSIQKEKLPQDRTVPLDAIIIFARPDKVYIPTGVTLTHKSPHALLPDMYIKKGVRYVQNSLFILTIRQFFAPVPFTYKKETRGFIKQIEPS